jgi:hypothetical protein
MIESIVNFNGKKYQIACAYTTCKIYEIVVDATISLVVYKTKTISTGTITAVIVVTDDSILLL